MGHNPIHFPQRCAFPSHASCMTAQMHTGYVPYFPEKKKTGSERYSSSRRLLARFCRHSPPPPSPRVYLSHFSHAPSSRNTHNFGSELRVRRSRRGFRCHDTGDREFFFQLPWQGLSAKDENASSELHVAKHRGAPEFGIVLFRHMTFIFSSSSQLT